MHCNVSHSIAVNIEGDHCSNNLHTVAMWYQKQTKPTMIDMMLKGGMMDTMRRIVSIHYLLVMICYDNITLCAMKNVVIMMIGETSTRYR